MAESKTIEALVVWIRHALEQAGVETAAQESRWLVAHALELESHHLASKAQEPVSAEQWAQAVSLASRRAAREPLQYILGTQEFCGLEFQVSPAVLIPRPETEVLVQEAVRAVDLDKESVLVDVGTGSGCVAVALAAILGNARIVAVDRSPQALVVAKGNAERHAVAEKIEWMESDLLSALRERGMAGTVDIIVSNPPYIAEADWAGLQPEVREFEPRSALFSGPTGTEFHERLLRESKEFLVPGGTLVMEIGQGQCAAVRQMAEHIGGYAPLRVVEDEAGIERVVIARRPD
ncbi:MAG: peptide chain release factor N(5)-glutamine methyltransferase [Nitrospira sp.]|nr:peptide chain release factor N(5)-glutamine methyltransferase [Nitrospira sp.]